MFRDIGDNVTPTIKDFNDRLEKVLNTKIEQEKYHLYVPIPLRYIEEDKLLDIPNLCRDQSKTYDYHFFGKKATSINSLMDTHIYRGTFQNLSSVGNTAFNNAGMSVG